MELDRYLAEKAGIVNRGLKDLLPKEDEYPQSLHRAMHYSLFAGGKRLRPILVLAACEAVGGKTDEALNAACAFECIHTYSLIHDDLPAIDNDDLRRGRPTCHKAWGEATAILAGDALLTSAFEIIAKTPTENTKALVRATFELARAAGSVGMIGGQTVDIESEGKEIPFPVLEYIHIHKTGELILASIRCGAILGGARDGQLDALTRYGQATGLAFQIADDILDVEGSTEEMGKAAGMDEQKGKATYPSLIGMDESKKRAAELVEKAVQSLSDFGVEAGPLRAIARFIVSRRK
ncbi:MAG: polyprenyl synthetase family protein [Deltaproteobacteria bacterium]|nr:polyprenyl synthetase family protein [Deltaproteobacteria bacterium]